MQGVRQVGDLLGKMVSQPCIYVRLLFIVSFHLSTKWCETLPEASGWLDKHSGKVASQGHS